MRLQYKYLVVTVFLMAFFYGLFLLTPPVSAYYACGTGPCNPTYQCNFPYSCSGVCGVYYDACVGSTCVDNQGWDSSTCTTGNLCTNPGTSRTASWGGWGACSPACGPGTQTRNCTCGPENNCPAFCSGGVACPGIGSQPCCTSQIPVTAPSAVTCTQIGIGRTAQVTWTFSDTGSTCGLAWGYNCAGNSESFDLRFSGGKATENVDDLLRTDPTDLFPDWGTYTVQVCALNGFGERCSVAANCVITAPPCTVGSQDTDANPDNTCRNTNPSLSASYGNNANQIRYLVDTTSTLTNPYYADSGWGTAASYGPVPTLATGTYYWNVQSQSTASPVACVTPAAVPTGMTLNIDRTAPGIPNRPVPTWTPDGSCLSSYTLSYVWNSVTDTGCASLPGTPYQIQVDSDSGYAAPVLYDSGWIAGTSYPILTPYPGGTTLYGRVHSRDTLNNTSAWSAGETTAFIIPTPTLYPTIHVWGNFIEDTGTTTADCTAGSMTVDPARVNLNLNIPQPTGVTSTCNVQASRYDCYIVVDNQNDTCVVPNYNVEPDITYDGYEDVEWREGSVCGGTPIPSIPVVAITSNPANPTPVNAFFRYGAQSWFKTRDTSFINKVTRNNVIPNNPAVFDVTDDSVAPPNNKFFTIGEAGAVTYNTSGKNLELGANATDGFSENKWFSSSYDALSLFSNTKFFDYVKSRKKYEIISNPSEIADNGIYYMESDVVVADAADFANKNVLLIINGTLTINGNFQPAGGSVGFIASAIDIRSNVTEVDAVLIGNAIDVSYDTATSPNKLKINGNLIQLSATPLFENKRLLINAQSPSIFIKMNMATYMNLLPYISTSLYDWRQIQ